MSDGGVMGVEVMLMMIVVVMMMVVVKMLLWYFHCIFVKHLLLKFCAKGAL